MKDFYVNPNWTFKETTSNLFLIKDDYLRILSSFLWFQLKERNNFIREAKNKIYNLPFEIWKKDRVWDYLNDNIEYDIFSNIL